MKYLTPVLLKTGLYFPLRKAYLSFRNRGASADGVFSDIYRTNRWGSPESRSGEGSSMRQTGVLRDALPGLLHRHGVGTLLDIPCGDFHWMSAVPLDGVKYTGADIVPDVIENNLTRYRVPGRGFIVADLCSSPLPASDMVFVRDCMVHLPFKMIAAAVSNLHASGSRLLMATTFPATQVNRDIALGDFRPINLQAPPFNFPPPIELLVEHCTESDGAHTDKAMGVWRISDLPRMGGT